MNLFRRALFPGIAGGGPALLAVAALLLFAGGEANALQLPAAVRLARKLEERAVQSLIRSRQPGHDAESETRRALHSITQARDVLVKKPRPRPPEYVEELENVRAFAYWISRKTPVRDVKGLDKLYLPKGPPEAASRRLFEKAEDYSRRRRSESFMLAARYFEITDRYGDTRTGRKARALYVMHRDEAFGGRAPKEAEPAFSRRTTETFRPTATKSRRDKLVEELAEMLRLPDLKPEDKLDACEKFLRELPGDPLVREVAALMDIFVATAPDERIVATKDYLRLFPQGYFGRHLPKIRDEASEEEDFDALVFELRSNSPPPEKERACRKFLAVHSGGAHAKEARALLKVHAARSQDRRLVAWLAYRAAFPAGVLRAQAEEQLRRSEPLLLVQIKQALVDDDEDRARSVGGVYLDLFPRGPAVREIRQLFQVLQKPRGPARAWAAEKYIGDHRNGTFTPILRRVVGIWRRKSEEADYRKVREAFATVKASEKERVKAIQTKLAALDEFLRANPTGAHAAEVRSLRSIFKLRGTKGRLVAARKYLQLYPTGGVVEAVRQIERELAEKHENEFYQIVASGLRNRTKSLEAKLAALGEYLAQYPQSAHAQDLFDEARKIRTRIAEEEKAFVRLEKELAAERDPAEGVRICTEFLALYPGGAHIARVKESKRGFKKRLLERQQVVEYQKLTGALRDDSVPRIERADRCLAYVRKYPKSRYLGDVRAAMAKFAPNELPSHAGDVRAAAFTNDSRHLVTLDASSRRRGSGVWVWRLPEGGLVARYAPRPRITVESAAFAPGGDELWVCESTGGLLAWAIPGGEITGRYRLGWGSLKAVGVSKDRDVVVSASYKDPKVRLWDAEEWTSEGVGYGIPSGGSAVAVDRRGALIAAGGRGGIVAVYEVNDTDPLWVADDVHDAEIDELVFSPDGRYLLSVSSRSDRGRGLVVMWEADSGDDLWQEEEKSTSAAFTGEGLVVTGPSLREAATGRVLAELGGSGAVAASPDGRFAFTTGEARASGILWYLPALSGR